jgi:hypothetical protein
VPREGLSESLVDPAVATIRRHGGEIRFGTRLREVATRGDAATRLDFDSGSVALGPDDRVVLAVPAAVAPRVLPGTAAPSEFRAIVNAHFLAEPAPGAPLFVGIVGGTAEWVFAKPGVLSVTVSAADRLVDRAAEDLAAVLWDDVKRAYGIGGALPRWRVVKEKRATFAATPAQLARRPGPVTSWRNLVLAGDWTDTGLPATIEGALLSGRRAAETLLAAAPAEEAARKNLSAAPTASILAPDR